MKANDKRALACTTCAKAKSRCIPGPEFSDKCERCHRLDKTCLSRAPAPPRAKNHVKRSRVAELEKRLSELEGGGVRALSAASSSGSQHSQQQQQQQPSQQLPGSSSSASSSATPPATSSAYAGSSDKMSAASPTDKSKIQPDMYFDHLFPTSMDHSSAWPSKESVASSRLKKTWDSLWPLPGEADILMAIYKSRVEHLFPFVIVPDMKSTELREQRPMLWKAIMMVGCFLDGARHERLAEEILAEISRKTMMDGDSSLDILQALQLLVAWYPYARRSSRMTNLLFLARSLCLSLGLGGNQTVSNDSTAKNLDSLRAYAGTYYVNTLVFTTNKRTEVLMNTAFLDKCCSILEEAKQYRSDEFLVKLVRVQQLAQSISLTLALEPDQQAMQLPMTMVVQSFQDQLNAMRQSLSPGLSGNNMLQSHISIAELILTEWSISDRYCNASNIVLTDRLRLLWSCVTSLKNIFHVRMGFWDDLDNPKFLCLHSSDLSYALITAVRVCTLRSPGWNLEHIERELSFGDVMDHLVRHLTGLVNRRRNGMFSSALREGGEPAFDDPIEALMNLCTGLRMHIRAEMTKAQAAFKEDPGAEVQAAAAAQAAAAQGFMEDLGDDYWRDYMIDTFWNGPQPFGDFELQ